ncbi:glycosyltransferase [Sphingomonas aerolata]|uniref:glycosyltransferase n=1 Tax=Sphingomonas aerolata TaxID=185951 RepID=UPI002FE35D1A
MVDAALVQAELPGVDRVSIVTRLFRSADLPSVHGLRSEYVTDRLTIDRVDSGDDRYLEKEALAADLPAFTEAFCRHIAGLAVMPNVIHAHFADAAAVAIEARRRFGIPFVYTPHALAIDKRRQGLGGAELGTRIAAETTAIAAADALIVSTRDEAERQVPAYGVGVAGRIHCVPPGVPRRPDTGGTATLVDRLGDWLDRPDLPILLAIARPVAKKNLAALVRAFAADPVLHERAESGDPRRATWGPVVERGTGGAGRTAGARR